MKKITILTIIAGVTLFILGIRSTIAVSKQEMMDTIQTVAQDFEKENGKQSCSIGGVNYSLSAVLYSLSMQEGGRKDGTIGEKTNNWGSLHKTQGVKQIDHTIYADNSKTRPVYKTAYDGVYEKAILITKSGLYNNCKLSLSSIKCYVKGCNAKMDKQSQEYIQSLYNNLKKNARRYDNRGKIDDINDKPSQEHIKTETYIEGEGKVCRKIRTIRKGDWIQADYGNDTRSMKVSDMYGDRLRLYSCYKK